MSRKNKLLIAAAAIAVLLLIGSGVARCSLAREDAPSAEPSTEARAEQPEGQTAAEADGKAQAESSPEEAGGLEALVGTSWAAADGSPSTLSIVKGAFVEEEAGQTYVTYWTVDSEETGDFGVTSVILASKSMTEAAAPTVVTVSHDGGAIVIRSDALAHPYEQVQVGASELSLSGVTSELEEAMGADVAEIEAAVAARAAAVSPSATRAVWDSEVWTDYANDMATTTFTLDDGAATMVSVTRSADGTVEAL